MAAKTEKSREHYIGEKRHFMRDGFGTYVYENAFFRYEGEWMKGKKHGHGKLIMKDGTYYEGQFVNGEINGHGYKYFALSSAKYTGQFLNGEMHGHGIMNYSNGNVYEGQWYKNKKQGFGILRTGEKSVYEGTFHGHYRDGEGAQTYDSTYQKLSNGDRFEGYWIMDKRQGHGELFCADGSHYTGQFMNDMFHGEGMMKHSSGIVYQGNWVNGFPVVMATKIVIIIEEDPLIVRQGQHFAIRVECRNEEDEIVPDMGRELQVMAGFKYRIPKEGSALFDMIEDVEDKPIPTPFGYDVVPYPLTDQLLDVQVPLDDVDSKTESNAKNEDDGEDKGEEEGEEDGNEDVLEPKEGGEEADATLAVPESGAEITEAPQDGSRVATPMEASSEDVTDFAPKREKSEEITPLLPPVPSQSTSKGVCEWPNLQLAPAPPMYRPFVIMEEEAGQRKKSKMAQLKERKSMQAPANLLKPDAEKSTASDEKIARTGEYILIVNDVSSPPFMGRRLEPAYLMLKLKRPKKIIVKKPKWDTQRHIAMAMSRSNSEFPSA